MKFVNIIGDVEKKNCIIVDDIIDSGGTLCNAAKAIIDKGASSVSNTLLGVLSGKANGRIANSSLKTVITNSINPSAETLSVKN